MNIYFVFETIIQLKKKYNDNNLIYIVIYYYIFRII